MLSGDKLKLIRIHQNLTQQELADGIGVSRRLIVLVENHNKSISQDLYQRWIDGLYTVKHIEKKQFKLNNRFE